ncbi:MAG: tripartite tricarboxylate transporter substrate binding protein [Burkholderiales bacterium]|nr:tripartite tricarboxylate transporter substrate binding protein [Burkholderiales bacterium]
MQRALRLVAAASLAVASFSVQAAESYPTRPVRFINPYPPGGGTDTFARPVAQKMSEGLGEQVLVDNRPGAQGSIGTALAAKAPPDGYTLILAQSGPFTINPFLYKDVGFDPLKDFVAVGRGTEQPYLVVVHPTVPARSMKELAAVARKSPGKLTYGSSSSVAQLVGELFKQVTATDVLHIPYKGAAAALVDLMSGQIDLMYSTPPSTMPHVKAGKLRALAVTGAARLPGLPDVPTSREAGIAEFEVTGWYGIALPAGTAREIVLRLNRELLRALDSPDVKSRLTSAGLDPSPSTPEQFEAQIRRDHARWAKVVKRAGIKAD